MTNDEEKGVVKCTTWTRRHKWGNWSTGLHYTDTSFGCRVAMTRLVR